MSSTDRIEGGREWEREWEEGGGRLLSVVHMQNYLHGIQKDKAKSEFVKQRTLCHTIAGNSVPVLTITSKVGLCTLYD